jgi:hypothetical protein
LDPRPRSPAAASLPGLPTLALAYARGILVADRAPVPGTAAAAGVVLLGGALGARRRPRLRALALLLAALCAGGARLARQLEAAAAARPETELLATLGHVDAVVRRSGSFRTACGAWRSCSSAPARVQLVDPDTVRCRIAQRALGRSAC